MDEDGAAAALAPAAWFLVRDANGSLRQTTLEHELAALMFEHAIGDAAYAAYVRVARTPQQARARATRGAWVASKCVPAAARAALVQRFDDLVCNHWPSVRRGFLERLLRQKFDPALNPALAAVLRRTRTRNPLMARIGREMVGATQTQ